MIEKRPLGILSLLDEECKFPKATDLTFLEKLHANHEKHSYYEKPRLTKTNFIVKHYAGDVSYECKGFLDKNKDTLQDDLLNVLIISKDKFIANMFTDMVLFLISFLALLRANCSLNQFRILKKVFNLKEKKRKKRKTKINSIGACRNDALYF